MRLGPAKKRVITARTNKREPLSALRAVLRGGLEFLKEFDNIAQVKWQLIVTIREKVLDKQD